MLERLVRAFADCIDDKQSLRFASPCSTPAAARMKKAVLPVAVMALFFEE